MPIYERNDHMLLKILVFFFFLSGFSIFRLFHIDFNIWQYLACTQTPSSWAYSKGLLLWERGEEEEEEEEVELKYQRRNKKHVITFLCPLFLNPAVYSAFKCECMSTDRLCACTGSELACIRHASLLLKHSPCHFFL